VPWGSWDPALTVYRRRPCKKDVPKASKSRHPVYKVEAVVQIALPRICLSILRCKPSTLSRSGLWRGLMMLETVGGRFNMRDGSPLVGEVMIVLWLLCWGVEICYGQPSYGYFRCTATTSALVFKVLHLYERFPAHSFWRTLMRYFS